MFTRRILIINKSIYFSSLILASFLNQLPSFISYTTHLPPILSILLTLFSYLKAFLIMLKVITLIPRYNSFVNATSRSSVAPSRHFIVRWSHLLPSVAGNINNDKWLLEIVFFRPFSSYSIHHTIAWSHAGNLRRFSLSFWWLSHHWIQILRSMYSEATLSPAESMVDTSSWLVTEKICELVPYEKKIEIKKTLILQIQWVLFPTVFSSLQKA